MLRQLTMVTLLALPNEKRNEAVILNAVAQHEADPDNEIYMITGSTKEEGVLLDEAFLKFLEANDFQVHTHMGGNADYMHLTQDGVSCVADIVYNKCGRCATDLPHVNFNTLTPN